jgi:protein-arginine kinase activator protein McsA
MPNPLCQRCGEREAEVFQTQHLGGKIYRRDFCAICARQDYGVFLGALLQSQAPGARPITDEEARELRRVLDEAAPEEE